MGLSTVDAFKKIRSENAITLSEEELAALQRTLNGMLKDLAECCKKHHLIFLMGGGSCLGTVRHHDFIPWDDDVDVNMPRADHDVFVKVFEEEYGDRYWVHTPEKTKGYGLTLSRILLKGTSVKTREDFHNEECGAFIDIFPIENTYDNSFLRQLHGLRSMAAGFFQSCAKFRRDEKELLELADSIEDPQEREHYQKVFRTKALIGKLTSFRSLDGWTRHCDRVYKSCKDASSGYVTMPSGRGHFFRELYRREELLPGISMAYGDTEYLVPARYDHYLTRLYGDYMQIPEEGQREKHVFFAPFMLDTERPVDPQ